MNIRRIVPDINTNHMKESLAFYVDFLGLQVAMDLNWIVTVVSPSNITAQINLLQNQSAVPSQSQQALSIEVADVDAMYAKAVALGI